LGLIANCQWQKAERELFVYVLDQSQEVSQLVQQVADELHEQAYHFLPTLNETTIMPSVTAWLKGFAEAKFVITDSFHGTVFAILFNKPFLVYANLQRGATRFTSLLKMFHLEERLVMNVEELIVEKIKTPIEWKTVNQIIEKERAASSAFLKNALNNL
jgi:exopolysaccharide biosynthesis predicted pyruvyltransferase EpsI